MTIKDYTRGFGPHGLCIVLLLLLFLFLVIPVSADESTILVNENNDPPPDTFEPDNQAPAGFIIVQDGSTGPDVIQGPGSSGSGLLTDDNSGLEPGSGDNSANEEIPFNPVEPEALVQTGVVQGDPPGEINEATNSSLPLLITTDNPGDPAPVAGDVSVSNSSISLSLSSEPLPGADIPLNNSGNSIMIPEPDELNNNLSGNQGGLGADTVLQSIAMNMSASNNSVAPDSAPVCTVNPPWAANLTDPPLNTTNLVPGIGAGQMWEINGTTGPGYYPVEINLDTLSHIGIWIHDVSNVVLDGLHNDLGGQSLHPGTVGILINGDVSNIQVKNFSSISNWFDGIVIQSGENITLGDNIYLYNNRGSGINVTDSSVVDITGPIESTFNDVNGILIRNSSDVDISGLIYGHDNQVAGINITNSTDVTIGDGIEIFNSPIGIKVSRSQDVQILGDVNLHGNSGSGMALSSTDNVLIGPNSSGYVRISYNDIGIDLRNMSNTRINDTSVFHNNNNGIYSYDSGQILLKNVTVDHNGDTLYEAGLRIEKADGWHHILESNFTYNSGDGIENIDSNRTQVENSTIRGNGASGIGIGRTFDPSGGSFDCSVTGSFIWENSDNGIASYASDRLTVLDTRIMDNHGDGIFLFHQFYATISDNYISDNEGSGINATGNSWENNITGNHLMYNWDGITLEISGKSNISGNRISGISSGTPVYTERGIVLQNGYGNTVHNNNISYFANEAMLVNQSNDNVISGNNFKQVGPGVIIQSSNGTIFEQNTIVVTGSNAGIECSHTNNTTITGNTISDGTPGLSLQGTDNTSVYNNIFDNYVNTEINGASRTSWNITPVPGPNIIGGPSLGGNYWGHGGWSQTNPDTDGDGFTDLPYTIEAGNVDQHPLSIAGEVPIPPPPAPKPPQPEPDNSVPVILTPPDPFLYSAGIVSEGFPDQVCAGSQVPVSVTVRADGNSTWFPGRVGIGSYNGVSQTSGPAFTPVTGETSVIPGHQYTFLFTITVPSVPGTYTFQYRMQKSDGTWFGDIFSIVVNVVDCSATKGTIKTATNGIHVLYKGNQVKGQPGLPGSPGVIAESVRATRFAKAPEGGSLVLIEPFPPLVSGSAHSSQGRNNLSGKYSWKPTFTLYPADIQVQG